MAANILMLAVLLLGGFTAYFHLPVEVEPSVTFQRVYIRVPLRGGSPKDVEQKIILPVEKALEGISGVDGIHSTASRNSGEIYLEASQGTDLDKLKNEIESRLDNISTFPQEAERASIFIPNTANWHEVISVAVYGELSENDLLKAAKKVRDDLAATPEISKVDIRGVRTKEIVIEIKPETLNAYNLSSADLSRAIRESSVDLSAGSINNNGERILIRSSSQAYLGEEFSNLLISRQNGSEVYLRDVATVKDGFEEDHKKLLYNGQPAIFLEVLRRDQENALKIADRVHAYVNQEQERFPEGIHLATWDDDSVSLKGRLKTLAENLFQGGILVLILLGLFLRPRIAFWVVAGIPISFAAAIIAMSLMGVTANNMSIFGFIIVLGIVVDDAIVTGENVYSHLKLGKTSPLESTILGTQEVTIPVTFGMLTTIAAFVPLLFIDGYLGEMAKQIPLVVIPVLIFSLIESKLILPSHLKHLKVNRSNTNIIVRLQRWIADGLEKFTHAVYKPLLKLALTFRYVTLSIFAALLMLTAGYYSKYATFNAVPSTDRYYIFSSLEMISGTPLEETDKRVQHIVAAVDSIRDKFVDEGTGKSLLGNIVTSSGGWPSSNHIDPTKGYILVEITPPSQRSAPGPRNSEIAQAWEEAVGEMAGVKNFRVRSERNNARGATNNDMISVQVRSHNDDERSIVIAKLVSWLKAHDSLKNAWSNKSSAQRELQVNLTALGREAQLSQEDLARQVRTAFYGTQVQKIQRGDQEVRVMLKFPQEMRESLHTLEHLKVQLPNKQLASISQFAEIKEGTSPPRIQRKDGMRVSNVYASGVADFKIINIEPELTEYLNQLTLEHPSVSWGYEGELADYKESNKRLLYLAIILAFTLFSLLSIPFKSYIQPLYVMIAIPFGIIGAYWGHVLLDLEVSYLSFFGMLALAGVVVNDSLVIIDFINKKRANGTPVHEAIAESGVRRFRPILLTTITTFAGLLPIMLETSIQAQFLIPMSVSLGFGILFATVITLFLTPCCYAVGTDFAGLFKKSKRGEA